MVVQLTLHDPRTSKDRNLVLRGDSDAPMAQLYEQFTRVHPGPYFIKDQQLSFDTTFGRSGLVDGSIVSLGSPRREDTGAGIELVVVGGRAAGKRFPLADGQTFTVGSGEEASIRLPDRRIANINLSLTVRSGRVLLKNLARQEFFVEGTPVHKQRELLPGEWFHVGNTLCQVQFGRHPNEDADITPNGEGRIIFNRPARIQPVRAQSSFTTPSKPTSPRITGFPWIQVSIPLVFSVATVLLFRNPLFLIMGLMSPVLAVANNLTQKKENGQQYQEQLAEYEQSMEKLHSGVTDAARWEARNNRLTSPNAIEINDIATRPTQRLWERRSSDEDFLSISIGTADKQSSVEVSAAYGSDDFDLPVLYDNPVVVDLKKIGVIGIAGEPRSVKGSCRWIISQLATLHKPSDLRFFLLTESPEDSTWEWMRWLPHAATDREPGGPFCTLATDRYGQDELIKSLLRTLAGRKEAKSNRDNSDSFLPAIVVVLDGVRSLRELNGIARILREGPEFGIFAIGLDSTTSRLAEETQAEITIHDDLTTAQLRMVGHETIENLVLDQVSDKWAERIARSIAPFVDAGEEEGGRSLPTSVRYVELADVDLDNPESVLTRWRTGGRTTTFLIGESLDGPFSLDLKQDGPHGLVAGTTGAGKSELLQTLVASLALANRPDALNFLLIDYKGASAFASCEYLPHTVGMVTNLDGHLTERALTALEAELHRREKILKDFQASDVDVAWQRDPQRAALEGLARLVIVIDEFAELNQELPEFVSGLIRVARVGRSLGVHLILGTQRPTGVVSPEMRANTGLRIALRMEDRNDSAEVLDEPDAASISRRTPGRGFARLGGGSGLIPFQTARIAGKRKGIVNTAAVVQILPMKWEQVGRPVLAQRVQETVESDTTDLHALVNLISKAAELTGIPPARSPWLPPLPNTFSLPTADVEIVGDAAFAIEDRPAEQKQMTVKYDLEHGGHLIIAGAARSGRTTAIRTIAASLANTWSPSDLHLIGMDFGNGSLLPLTSLRHCGAVTGRNETDRIERLVTRLMDEVKRRQQLFATAGVGDISEQRKVASSDDRLPYIVVLIDRWEGLLNEFTFESGSEIPDIMLRLIREGVGAGVRFVITGDRGLLIDRISAQIEHKLILRLGSKEDYGLIGIPSKSVPDEMPPGRALWASSQLELQFALLNSDPSSASQNEEVEHIANTGKLRWPVPTGNQKPIRVDPLPSVVTMQTALELPSPSPTSPLSAIVGVGGDDLHAMRVELLTDGPFFLIAGQPKSGRSTAGLTIAETILNSGGGIIAVCPKASPLQTISSHPNATVFRGTANEAQELVETLNAFEQSVAIIVDDSEIIANNQFDETLREIMRKHSDEIATVVIGAIDSMQSSIYGISMDARKSKIGLIFSPESSLDGDLLGLRIPRNLVGRAAPGRAIFCKHGEATLVQVPLP